MQLLHSLPMESFGLLSEQKRIDATWVVLSNLFGFFFFFSCFVFVVVVVVVARLAETPVYSSVLFFFLCSTSTDGDLTKGKQMEEGDRYIASVCFFLFSFLACFLSFFFSIMQ